MIANKEILVSAGEPGQHAILRLKLVPIVLRRNQLSEVKVGRTLRALLAPAGAFLGVRWDCAHKFTEKDIIV